MIILFKAKKFDGRMVTITTENMPDVQIFPFSVKRCTGIVDDGNVMIYEKDYLEIYDKNGDLLYSGTVIYSTTKGAFILVDEKWANLTDKPIGELIKDRICHVVVNG